MVWGFYVSCLYVFFVVVVVAVVVFIVVIVSGIVDVVVVLFNSLFFPMSKAIFVNPELTYNVFYFGCRTAVTSQNP